MLSGQSPRNLKFGKKDCLLSGTVEASRLSTVNMTRPEGSELINGFKPRSLEPSIPPSYSAFQPWQKRCIIAVVAFGGWFSSLSSFIYFPAIPALAEDLGVSVEKINLTVTSYLIMSGIFPALVGNAADKLGRRPVFLATLVVYVGANIGLALQNSFGLLFFLRMLQSAGISGKLQQLEARHQKE